MHFTFVVATRGLATTSYRLNCSWAASCTQIKLAYDACLEVIIDHHRTFSPLVAGGLFSLSLSSTLSGFSYPLDYRLVYLFFGFILLLCVFFVACLPLSINKQKIIEDVHVVDK